MKFSDALKSIDISDGSSTSNDIILITGGNGVVSYRIIQKLLSTGHVKIRIGVPNVQEFQTQFPSITSCTDIVELDWDKPMTYHDALIGVKSVFIALPHHNKHDMVHNFNAFLLLAQQAGVNHYVKLSFYHAMNKMAQTPHEERLNAYNASNNDPFLQIPLVLMHRECDTLLTRMSVVFNYTLLFASHFMSNITVYQASRLNKDHEFIGASDGKGVNYVSPNDIAEVAVRALLAPKEHQRVGYTLTGPTAITDQSIATILGTKMGERIKFVDTPIKSFVPDTIDWGTSNDVTYMEYVKATGYEETSRFVSDDIRQVCGHPAETFEQYIDEQDYMTPQELQYLHPVS